MKSITPRRIAVAASFLFFPIFAVCQTAVTSLHGAVHDPSGALIPGAQITILKSDTGFTQVRSSDAHGEYAFEQIPPGHYVIKAAFNGFATQEQKQELLVNEPATINFSMSVSSATTTVEVGGEAPALNTTDATIGTPFNTTQIQLLPFEGNNVLDLLSLQAGVLFLGDQTNQQQDSDSRSGTVDGARSDQSNTTLDGLDDNDQNKGYAFSGVLRSTRDSVEEFRVTTTNSNADSGRSSGAQVALVTRSGTNNLHGSAYEYYRPTNTVANNWFNKQAQVLSGEPNIPGKFLRNTFGMSLGGPVKQDKLFYFVAYEGQKTSENEQVTQEVPGAAFRTGQLTYVSASGTPVTLGRPDIAKMDPMCGSNGTCPLGNGVNPAALAYFQSYPLPNGNALGDGYNLASYTFSSPAPQSLNTLIVRLDYNMNNSHQFFVRGNLQGDNTDASEQFPGAPPNYEIFDNSKGIAAGYVWTISNSKVNNLRYGFVRQGFANRGATNSDYVTFSSMASLLPTSNTSSIGTVPVHNVVDDFNWVKGDHTIQIGGNYRAIFNNSQSDSTLFNSAAVTYSFLTIGSIANTGTSLDPKAFGYPAVSSGFANAYNRSISDITGLITNASAYYNYQVSGNSLNPAPAGQYIKRNYFSNEVEYYLQDSWKVKSNLTFTYGLRHTMLQVPYERNGQEVAPTFNLGTWFNNRAASMLQGTTNQPTVSFTSAGRANGKAGLWNMDKLDLAPRVAFAYSPNFSGGILGTLFGNGGGHSSIRGGYGLYYDHFGEGVIDSFNQFGSFGLSTLASNGVDQNVDTAPRYSSQQAIPTSIIPPVTSTGTLPVTPGNDLALTWGVDGSLRTPYSHVFDFAIERDLPKGMSLEFAYTGRLGRRLLQMRDLSMPLDLVDPASGSDYFAAATQLSKYVDAGTNVANIPAIPYWEHMFPLAAGGGYTATQNIYQNQWVYFRGNETAGLYDLDLGNYPGAPNNEYFRYFDPQYASLYGWSSIGSSTYHGLQVSFHRPMTHGIQFDVYYTLSKSIDLGSDTERSAAGGTFAGAGAFSQIINSFNPKGNRAVSDFDVRHNIAANWIVGLPFGRGAAFASDVNRFVDTFIGGWTLTGLSHWTSGLPFDSIDGLGWGTNWADQSWNVVTGKIAVGGHHLDSGGQPNAFKSATEALANIRAPYPGETGERNVFRGDGYFSVDSGLAKVFPTFEHQQLKFAWEVFNVTNSVRFDPHSISNDPFGSPASFGRYSTLLTAARNMQFSLRYSF